MNAVFLRPIPVIVALLFTGGALRAQSADALIAEGDLFYAKFQATEALKYYLPAEKLEPNNVRLLCRISREYRHLMMDETDRTSKVRLGGEAVDYAKRAVTLSQKILTLNLPWRSASESCSLLKATGKGLTQSMSSRTRAIK